MKIPQTDREIDRFQEDYDRAYMAHLLGVRLPYQREIERSRYWLSRIALIVVLAAAVALRLLP